MQRQTITPRSTVESKGRILYSESSQAWNLVRLKAEFLKDFHQLKEKTSKFSYNLIYYRTYEEFEKAVKELIKKGEVLHVLMFLKKES